MIKQTKIVNEKMLFGESKPRQHLNVEFTDGTFVNLNERELKEAAALAEKGCLND